jgi:hypothetical protein
MWSLTARERGDAERWDDTKFCISVTEALHQAPVILEVGMHAHPFPSSDVHLVITRWRKCCTDDHNMRESIRVSERDGYALDRKKRSGYRGHLGVQALRAWVGAEENGGDRTKRERCADSAALAFG